MAPDWNDIFPYNLCCDHSLELSDRVIVVKPGRVAQSVGHLTRKSEVRGSIPGLAIYFRFSFR